MMAIRQGIEQRSEWSKSMMRDVSGCRAALQWDAENGVETYQRCYRYSEPLGYT